MAPVWYSIYWHFCVYTLLAKLSSQPHSILWNTGNLATEESWTRSNTRTQSAATKRVSEESYPIFTNNNNSTTSKIDHLLSTRSRSPLSIREPTPTMIEPGSGFSTLQSQASSTISTFNSPMPHYQMQDHTPHHQRFMDNTTPSSRPLSDLIIPIATPTSNEFSVYSSSADAACKRSLLEPDVYLELEERNKTILMLTSLLQKVYFDRQAYTKSSKTNLFFFCTIRKRKRWICSRQI